MKPIAVAVVIVSYKSAALTIDCLRSIESERKRSGVSINVVVVDNASGDTPAIAQALEANSWSSWVTLVTAPRNGGFAYGNNLAIRRTKADGSPDYFLLLNPDTQVRHGAIDALVRFLEHHPAVGIAGSSFENPDGSDWPIAFRFPSMMSEIESGLELGLATRLLRRWVVPVQMTAPQPIDWVPGASMMIRPAVLDEIGGFDENYFLYFEETDFCFRAKKAGFPTWYVPESRVMHIAGQSTKVTERNVPPRRLPSYWFESRRRYFRATHGAVHAITIDMAAILAHSAGSLKRLLQGRTGVPHFLRDLIVQSALWPGNRGSAANGLKLSLSMDDSDV